MNRRQFLTRLSVAMVGAAVATKVPTQWLPTGIQRRAACEYLRRVYNAYAQGRGIDGGPRLMQAGHDLFEAYEQELMVTERFCIGGDPSALCFKGAKLVMVGQGWYAQVIA